MPRYTVSIDDEGAVMVDDAAPREIADSFGRRFGRGRVRYCAVPRPDQLAALPDAAPPDTEIVEGHPMLRVHSIYHRSLTDGPGRRSTLKLQGCSIGISPTPCAGCIVPDTHDPAGGVSLAVAAVAQVLADPTGAPRDGYSLLGGDPLDQAQGVGALIAALRRRDPRAHIAVYSGYTLAELLDRADPWVRRALELVDLLVDGRFERRLTAGAGPYRGSTNQRLHDRVALAAALAAAGPCPHADGPLTKSRPRVGIGVDRGEDRGLGRAGGAVPVGDAATGSVEGARGG